MLPAAMQHAVGTTLSQTPGLALQPALRLPCSLQRRAALVVVAGDKNKDLGKRVAQAQEVRLRDLRHPLSVRLKDLRHSLCVSEPAAHKLCVCRP